MKLCFHSLYQASKDAGILVVDAGGGTIDISAYAIAEGSEGKKFEEMHEPQCNLTFAIFF